MSHPLGLQRLENHDFTHREQSESHKYHPLVAHLFGCHTGNDFYGIAHHVSGSGEAALFQLPVKNLVDTLHGIPQAEVLLLHVTVLDSVLPRLARLPESVAAEGQVDVENASDFALEVVGDVVGVDVAQIAQVGVELMRVHQGAVHIVEVVENDVGPEDEVVEGTCAVAHHLAIGLVETESRLQTSHRHGARDACHKLVSVAHAGQACRDA